MEDIEIVRGLRRGDETALCAAIDGYGNYVSAILCNMTRGLLSVQDVEEAAADVFAALWRNGPALRETSLRPYLAQAARNMARSRLRGFRGILPLEADAPAPDSPEEDAILREQTEIVDGTLETIGEPDREIFVRYYFFGERIQGISGRMGIKAATVKTKLRRVREKLRNHLTERGYGREKA